MRAETASFLSFPLPARYAGGCGVGGTISCRAVRPLVGRGRFGPSVSLARLETIGCRTRHEEHLLRNEAGRSSPNRNGRRFLSGRSRRELCPVSERHLRGRGTRRVVCFLCSESFRETGLSGNGKRIGPSERRGVRPNLKKITPAAIRCGRGVSRSFGRSARSDDQPNTGFRGAVSGRGGDSDPSACTVLRPPAFPSGWRCLDGLRGRILFGAEFPVVSRRRAFPRRCRAPSRSVIVFPKGTRRRRAGTAWGLRPAPWRGPFSLCPYRNIR